MERVAKMNAEHVLINGEAGFGGTKFSDISPEEFKANNLGNIPTNKTVQRVLLMVQMQTTSIGYQKVPLLEEKTKVDVVHVGLFLPWQRSRVMPRWSAKV